MTKSPETIWAAEMAVRLSEMQAERDAAIARAEKAEVATRKWQSIETAPKDGTPFLGCEPDYIFVAIWDRGNRVHLTDTGRGFCYPTHWMPLPPPPETP